MMKSKLLILTLLLCTLGLTAFSQTAAILEISEPTLEKLAWNEPVSRPKSYTDQNQIQPSNKQFDKHVLDYINEMRQDPGAFYHNYVKDYIRKNQSRFTNYYTHSVKKDLEKANPLPLFIHNPVLVKAASQQLDYLVGLGGNRLTHVQGKISFADRMKETGLHCFAENLYRATDADALQVVLDLLIDQGITSLGHRKNLLNPTYTQIGIQSKVAANGYNIVVMDFGCEK